MYQLLRQQNPKLKCLSEMSSLIGQKYPVAIQFWHRGAYLVQELINDTHDSHWNSDMQLLRGPKSLGPQLHSYDKSMKLEPLRQLYQRYLADQSNIKFRREGERFTIYVVDANQAQSWINWALKINKRYANDSDDPEFLLSVRALADNIPQGATLCRRSSLGEYQWKIYLSSRYFRSDDEAGKFSTALSNFKSEIRLTPSLTQFMTSGKNRWGGRWLGATHIFARDQAVATYLSLIWPDMIKKIDRLVHKAK